MPTVSAAQFIAPDPNMIGGPWALCISAQGDGFVERAIPLSAKVGDVFVQAIFQLPTGDGFTGYLATTPEDGAVLSIGYGDELTPTLIVYQSGGTV
jgi:hypothetical protein